MSDLVTVYIPTYNRNGLLRRALKSVLNQTYRNMEIIVVDDGSNDGTREFLAEMSIREGRVRYLVNKMNLGACASRNKAIEAATGRFITGLDDDDYFMPGRIQDFVESWERRNQGAIALFTSFRTRSGESEYVSNKKRQTVNQADLAYSNYIGNQVFTDTNYLRHIGGFDTALPAWQDIDCWYRLLGAGFAERVDNESYVVDVSHDYDRISEASLEKVSEACRIMVARNSVGYRDAVRLQCQISEYSPSISRYVRNAFSALLIMDLRLLRLTLKRLKRNILT